MSAADLRGKQSYKKQNRNCQHVNSCQRFTFQHLAKISHDPFLSRLVVHCSDQIQKRAADPHHPGTHVHTI